ncbi:hypothetical protein HLB23_40220 [Nocardia uniformis]|uniref:Uncharacterized protein n=1 Tax=Nocardia uniformis TaxID=53432 RepID=A0A849CIC3_9NOCA
MRGTVHTYRVAELHAAPHQRAYAPRYLAHAMPWSHLFTTNDTGGRATRVRRSRLDRTHHRLLIDTTSSAHSVKRYEDRHNAFADGFEDLDSRDLRQFRSSRLPPYAEAILLTGPRDSAHRV